MSIPGGESQIVLEVSQKHSPATEWLQALFLQELQPEAQCEISGTYQTATLDQDSNAETSNVKRVSNKSQDQAQGQQEKVLKDSNDKVEPLLTNSQKSKTRSRGLLKALLSRFRAQNPAAALDLRESASFGSQQLAQQADLQIKSKSRDNTKTTNDEVKSIELKMKDLSEVPQARNSKLIRNSAISHKKARRLQNEYDSEGGTSSVELDSMTNLNEGRENGASDSQPNRVKFAASQNMEENESNNSISADDRFLVSEPESEDSRQNRCSSTANIAKPPFLPRPKSEKHRKNVVRHKITNLGAQELLESQSVPIQARMARPRSFSRFDERRKIGRLSLKDNRQADGDSHGSIDENMRTSFKTPDVPESVFTNPKDSSSGEEAVSRVPDYLRQESDFTQAESLVFGLSEQYSSEGERELHQAMKEKMHWSPKKGSSLPLEKILNLEKSPRHIGSPWHPDSSLIENPEEDGKNAKLGTENSLDQEKNTDKVIFDLDLSI